MKIAQANGPRTDERLVRLRPRVEVVALRQDGQQLRFQQPFGTRAALRHPDEQRHFGLVHIKRVQVV